MEFLKTVLFFCADSVPVGCTRSSQIKPNKCVDGILAGCDKRGPHDSRSAYCCMLKMGGLASDFWP